MTTRDRVPRPTVKRLSLYLRELEGRSPSPRTTISSRDLATAIGVTDAQVRKDLAVFGQFGQPGIGYRAGDLITSLRRILGTDRRWRTVVAGAGNIGRAVLSYARLEGKGFDILAAFDADPQVIGTSIGAHRVQSITEMEDTCRALGAEVGMLAVPASAAQDVAEQLVRGGVCGILNFAPVHLSLPPHIAITSVDLTVSLEQLVFRIAANQGTPGPG